MTIEQAKKAAAKAASLLVEDGMVIGLGSGSTSAYFIEFLSQRKLKIKAIASSVNSMNLAKKLNIELMNPDAVEFLDLTIDGADEIDHQKNMIKGGGGALLREKILAKSSREMIVIVDETKVVDRIGAHFVPVEIAPFAYKTTLKRLENYSIKLRMNQGKIYVTDNGNYVADIQFKEKINNPKEEEIKLLEIAGVLATGLFYHVAGRVIIGYKNGFAVTKNMLYP